MEFIWTFTLTPIYVTFSFRSFLKSLEMLHVLKRHQEKPSPAPAQCWWKRGKRHTNLYVLLCQNLYRWQIWFMSELQALEKSKVQAADQWRCGLNTVVGGINTKASHWVNTTAPQGHLSTGAAKTTRLKCPTPLHPLPCSYVKAA